MTKKEILYRAKSKAKGEWLYGHVFEEFFYRFKEGWVKEWVLQPIRDKVTDAGCRQIVDANTICEYTGLYDKNGTKVFSGDIVVTRYTSGEICSIGDVQFACGVFGAEWTVHKKSKSMVGGWGQLHNLRRFDDKVINEIEVVGNKFDNPELLEVQE